MKKLLSIVFFVQTLFLFSQSIDVDCISNFDTNPDPEGMYSYSTTFNETLPPMVLNVKFWALRLDDGTSAIITNESDVLHAIANLNIAYNDYNIYFKYSGFEYVDDDTTYFENSLGVLKNRFNILGLETEFTLNVILHSLGLGSSADNPGNFAKVHAAYLTEWVTIHEIGHNLGLGHTFEKYGTNSCEHVTRDLNDIDDPTDPNDTYFNATTHGDKIVDTAAIWTMKESHFYDFNNCEFTQIGADCQGTLYDLKPVDLLNYMNANIPNSIFTCRSMFSDGQGVRMRETIVGRPDIFVPVGGTVPDLYEPYAGEYYNSGPNLPTHTSLFQPGFDYYFVECCCDYPQPSVYNDVSFSFNNNNYVFIDKYDLNPITHPNHRAIIINQLADIHNGQARKCYDNWNRSLKNGSITLFNDNVINTNVTITPKDSLGINNQNLIQNLDDGLYKIEKNYEDGSTKQTIIYKGNN